MLRIPNPFRRPKAKESKAPLSRQELAKELMNQVKDWTSLSKKGKESLTTRIVKLAQSVYREEIEDWQNAVSMAIRPTNPNPYKLIEIYRRTMRDTHLSAAIRNRKSRIKNKAFVIKDADGTINRDKTKLLNRKWFRKYLNFELDTIFYGFGLAWFGSDDNMDEDGFNDFFVVPRQNILPHRKEIVTYRGNTRGDSFDSDDMKDWRIWSCLDDVWDEEHLGLLNKAAPLVIMKKHSFASWDGYEERHGIPMVVYMTAMGDDNIREQIFEWLSNLTHDNVAVLPDIGGELKLIEPSNSDVFNVFDKKIERVNSELSKLVEGATSTLDQGQKFQVSDVHQNTANNNSEDDMQNMTYKVQEPLLPFLQLHGYPFDGGETFEFITTETLSKKEKLDYAVKLGQQGYKFDVEQLQELVGIEITSEPQTVPALANRPKAKKTEASKPANALGENWRQQLGAVYAGACKKCKDSPLNEGEEDITTDDFKAIWDRLAQSLHDGETIIIDEELWSETNTWLTLALDEGLELADNAPSEALILALRENVSIFSAFKTYQELRLATDLLIDEDGGIRSFSSFRDEIEKLSETFNVHYLKSEYINAVTSAQSAAAWERFEEDKDVFDLQYVTAGDERVREEHEVLDGLIRPVDDKIWDTIMPPNGWRCRCDVQQVEIDEDARSDADEAQRLADRAHRNEIFKFNAGKERQAFSEKHPYYQVQNASDREEIERFIDDNV